MWYRTSYLCRPVPQCLIKNEKEKERLGPAICSPRFSEQVFQLILKAPNQQTLAALSAAKGLTLQTENVKEKANAANALLNGNPDPLRLSGTS